MKFYSLLIVVIVLSLFLVGIGAVIAATEQSTTATVTVSEWLSVTLSNVPVNFPTMDPSTTKNASVGSGFPATATIGSESNVNANVSTRANQTNFAGPSTFAVSNMRWSATVPSLPGGTNYTTSDAQVCSSVIPGSACNIYHQLTVPSAQAAGTYNVSVTITATKA